MTLPNILENARSLFKATRRRRGDVQNGAAEVRIENLEQRALLTLIGAEVAVQNLFVTGNPAVDAPLTMFGEPAFGVVENRVEPEFVQFVDEYDIDINANSISMVYNLAENPTVKAPDQFGIFDRYVFSISGLAPNHEIVGAAADSSQGLVPSVEISGDLILVTIGPDQTTGPGQNALINLDIRETSPVSLVGTDVTLSQTIQANLQSGGIEVPNGADAVATIAGGTQESEFAAAGTRDLQLI